MHRFYDHIRNMLLPCLVFSVITGFFSAVIITAFKVAVEKGFRDGGAQIRALGYRLESLAIVEYMDAEGKTVSFRSREEK